MQTILHNSNFCHCSRCWQPSKTVKVVKAVAPWVAYAAVLYVIGHLVIWAVNQFPGLNRIQ